MALQRVREEREPRKEGLGKKAEEAARSPARRSASSAGRIISAEITLRNQSTGWGSQALGTNRLVAGIDVDRRILWGDLGGDQYLGQRLKCQLGRTKHGGQPNDLGIQFGTLPTLVKPVIHSLAGKSPD